MTDVKIKDGDTVKDSTGQLQRISDTDALFQRVEICIGATLGNFIYDRNLGSKVSDIKPDSEYAKERAELVINETLAAFENTHASVIEFGDTIKLTVKIGHESRYTEVHLNGSV